MMKKIIFNTKYNKNRNNDIIKIQYIPITKKDIDNVCKTIWRDLYGHSDTI